VRNASRIAASFRQRYGIDFEDLVRRFMSASTPSVVVAPEDEQTGRARALRAELLHEENPNGTVDALAARPEIVVAASGNLALVYLARHPGRMCLEDIENLHPALLPGLVGHAGIGWVMVRSRRLGPVVLGRAGRRVLADDRIEGVDPLAGFGPMAADDLRRHDALPHVGDILVNSALDPETEEVAAFEELIGCHGGMGGWQDRPVLIHPAAWPVTAELTGADAVHRQLVRWMEQLGQRAVLGEPTRREPARPEPTRLEPTRPEPTRPSAA